MNKLIILLMAFVVCYKVTGQSLNKSELNFLHSTISIFILDHEKLNGFKERNSESFFFLLDVDSNAKIEKLQLLADDNNKDSAFKYISLIQPTTFQNKKFENCKGKTIMIPIICFSYDRTSPYIKALMTFYSRKTISVINESSQVVLTSLLKYDNPVISKENLPDTETQVKKKN